MTSRGLIASHCHQQQMKCLQTNGSHPWAKAEAWSIWNCLCWHNRICLKSLWRIVNGSIHTFKAVKWTSCKTGGICGGVLWKDKILWTGFSKIEIHLTQRLWKIMDGSRWTLLLMTACTLFLLQANISHSLSTSKVQWSLRPLIFQSVIWGRRIPDPLNMDFCRSLSCLLHCKQFAKSCPKKKWFNLQIKSGTCCKVWCTL